MLDGGTETGRIGVSRASDQSKDMRNEISDREPGGERVITKQLIVLAMSNVDPNPYEPPILESNGARLATRWRVLPAAGSFLLGFVSFVFGVFAVAVMVYVIVTQNASETIGEMLAGCTLYLGFGTAWMFAGWSYWCQRYRRGLIANGVGMSFPVVLFSILGW